MTAAHLDLTDGQVDRTRPLCPYPQVARYDGSGSIDNATSFVCEEPPAMRPPSRPQALGRLHGPDARDCRGRRVGLQSMGAASIQLLTSHACVDAMEPSFTMPSS